MAQGPHSASCSASLQSTQNHRRTPEDDMDPDSCQVPPASQANRSLAPSPAGQGSLHFPYTSSSGKLTVRLCHHALWRQFSQQQNEMVLTKKGRAMFPFLVYKIQGMDPSALYHVSVEVRSVDKYHWRYQSGRWLPYEEEEEEEEEEENLPGKRCYEHPHSPNTGAHWMDGEISFQKLRLTNQNTACQKGSHAPILLKSLHKYQPSLHIEKVSHGKEQALAASSRHTFSFPDTHFIAVTAYQNAGITRLKIENNPFATGHRRRASRPGPSLHKAPAAGQCTQGTSSPPSPLPSTCPVQAQHGPGPGQDKDCHLMCASLPSSGHLHDSRESTSATSLALTLTVEGLNAQTLPCVLPSAGNWPPSLSTCMASANSMDSLRPDIPKPQQAGPETEEEEGLQEQLCQARSRAPSHLSNLGQTPSKKRCLSPVDSAKDFLASALETREQEDTCFVASESRGNSTQETLSEASCSPVILQEGAAQTQEKRNSTPCNSNPDTQPHSELPNDSNDKDLHSVLPEFVSSISLPAMPEDNSPDTHITQGKWSHSPSSCTPNVNRMQSFLPGSPKPQQGRSGTEEEVKLPDQLSPNGSRTPSDVRHLGQRGLKKTYLVPEGSEVDSLASARTNWTQEDECLIVNEVIGCGSQEAVSEGSYYPAGMQDETAQVHREMGLNHWDSFQVSQPLSEFPFNSRVLDLDAVDHLCLPSTSLSTQSYEASPDVPITEGNWTPYPSSCTSHVNTMESFQSVHPETQQASIWTEEEETLQDQLGSASSRITSDITNLVISDMETSASAWTNWTQEDEWLIVNEVIGCGSQEAVSEGSNYPAGMQDATAQVHREMGLNHWDSFQVSQPSSEFPCNPNALDLHAVDHHCLPSTSLPTQSYEASPDVPITEGNWTPYPSSCTSHVNTMECFQSVHANTQQASIWTEEEEILQHQRGSSSSRITSDITNLVISDMESSASAWTNWTQEDEWLIVNEVIGCGSQEAVSEGSYYPEGMQEDTAELNGEMVLNPLDSFQG